MFASEGMGDVIKFCSDFQEMPQGLKLQNNWSADPVGANYRAALRAKSTADFVYKIEVVLQEADESHYWLEVVKDAEIKIGSDIDELIKEADEITAIFTATDKTGKNK